VGTDKYHPGRSIYQILYIFDITNNMYMKHILLVLMFLVPLAEKPQAAPDLLQVWGVFCEIFAHSDTEILFQEGENLHASMIKSRSEDRDFWIAPNPASDFLSLYSANELEADAIVRIFNIVGRELKTLYPKTTDSETILREDVSSWLPGTYLVRIESNGKVLKTMRFVRR
jgi:hypothetical protein